MAEQDFALVIGIERYPFLQSLNGAVDDATEFYDWLLKAGKVPKDNIEFIVSRAESSPKELYPIQCNIDDAFGRLFKSASRSESSRRLYVYFAGHGLSQDLRHVALVMADATKLELNRSLNAHDYHKGLALHALFTEQIIFYDCCRCFDQRVSGRGPSWNAVVPRGNAAEVIQFILYGAGFTQYSYERRPSPGTAPRGLFTRALLEGLREGNVRLDNGNWAVKADELIPRVSSRLMELARAEGLEQKVNIERVGDTRELILATYTTSPETVRVHLPPGDSSILVQNHKMEVVYNENVSCRIVNLVLPPGLYSFCSNPSSKTQLFDVRPGSIIDMTI